MAISTVFYLILSVKKRRKCHFETFTSVLSELPRNWEEIWSFRLWLIREKSKISSLTRWYLKFWHKRSSWVKIKYLYEIYHFKITGLYFQLLNTCSRWAARAENTLTCQFWCNGHLRVKNELIWSVIIRILSKLYRFIIISLRFRKAGRVWCGGARETHWATCHNEVTPSETKELLKSPCFFRT